MRFVQRSEPEIAPLPEGHKNGSQFQFRHRRFCLVRSNQGQTVAELAQFFEVSRLTIYL
jgi:hypothetical protein